MTRHGSMAEQLINYGKVRLKPANDNKPREPHYRGTLPALRWLYDNHPELAPAFASALPRPPANWFVEVEPTRQEIRPTIGEVMKASHDDEGNQLPIEHGQGGITIGALRFRKGALVEWGTTKKGKKLKPTDRARPTGEKTSKARNATSYLALKGAVPSPMHADHYHRPLSGEPALASMYDPLPGVEANRALLRSLGVDGEARADQLPHGVTFLPTVIADGAEFLGGVANTSGNSSSGAVMWDGPDEVETDARVIIEEVAARGTLKSIGMRLGYSEANAIAAGKQALIEVADILKSIRDRKNLQAA